MNNNKKISSVFTYSYFWIAIIIPLSLSSLLMSFIFINDGLSIEWPNKETLSVFLEYMNVPLWILGSALPLATLATANFRALQFQSNLNYQKRTIERQEFEHKIDLYHKELTLFREKFSAVIFNGNFKCIRPEDATLIFTRFYPKPTKKEDPYFEIDIKKIEYIYEFMKLFEAKVFEFGKIANTKRNKLKFINLLFPDFSEEQKIEQENSINIYTLKIVYLLGIMEATLLQVCHVIGIRHFSIGKEPITLIIKLIIDIYALQTSFLDDGESECSFYFSQKRQSALVDILNLWIKYSSISNVNRDKYTADDFRHECFITEVLRSQPR